MVKHIILWQLKDEIQGEEKESVKDRLARMQQEAAARAAAEEATGKNDLVGQLTHETDGDPDFAELAEKLEERKFKEAKGENEGHVKMTIYVEKSLAKSFNALITKRGQQKQVINQAIKDFVIKKSRELGV